MHFKCQVPVGSANSIPGNLRGGMERMTSYLGQGGPLDQEGRLLTRHQGQDPGSKTQMALHFNIPASTSQSVYWSPGPVLAVSSGTPGPRIQQHVGSSLFTNSRTNTIAQIGGPGTCVHVSFPTSSEYWYY